MADALRLLDTRTLLRTSSCFPANLELEVRQLWLLLSLVLARVCRGSSVVVVFSHRMLLLLLLEFVDVVLLLSSATESFCEG